LTINIIIIQSILADNIHQQAILHAQTCSLGHFLLISVYFLNILLY